MAKIHDLQNCFRWYNCRIRGLPESFKYTNSAVCLFLKELLPNLPDHCLELDRAHRALQPLCQDGLSRDIIVKLYYYAVKEAVINVPGTLLNCPYKIMQSRFSQIFCHSLYKNAGQ